LFALSLKTPLAIRLRITLSHKLKSMGARAKRSG